MIRCIVLFLILSVAAWAEPRVFVPVYLNPGSINEVYVWDEASPGAFRVEVRRPGAEKPFAVARGFTMDLPLAVLGVGNRPLKWSAALVAPDWMQAPGLVEVRVLTTSGTVLAVVESELRTMTPRRETIVLDRAMSDLRSKPDKRKDREAAEIGKVYQRFDPRTSWGGGRFLHPIAAASRLSALFGDLRDYQYADGTTARDYHKGTDFAAPVGTPVSAPAAGVVAFVADRMLTGKTVVLEHAPGVQSVYFHLSHVVAKKGQRLASGDLLGQVGATGLVTGPHLHWEVRVNAVPVDPLDLMLNALLDTQVVSAVISSIERPIH